MSQSFRAAFYGRVSTEDQQDPNASRGWQLRRARQLIEVHGGEIAVEFFDAGLSRAIPWDGRPEAARLLALLPDPARGFDAVVIGEPARAFYGNQFSLTFPLFVHYGIDLWVPEVGGRVDPDSEAHELQMVLFGGMSKSERQRIKVRVRAAMADQAAREGRFLGGRPPYGYRLVDAGVHPNPAKAADGKHLRALEPDPATTPMVQRIFTEYLAGTGLYAIAEGLTRDGVPSPSMQDRARNRHRTGGAWSKSAVRAILANPRYTGYQVWNRQRRVEILKDVRNVAAGHVSQMRWNEPTDWVWSAQPTHEALITTDTFTEVSSHLAAGRNRPATRKPRRTRLPYLLRGLLHCGVCGRRMQGQVNHDELHYRCRYPSEYALANTVEHPRNIYVRQDRVVPPLDAWLVHLFDSSQLDDTCAQLAAAARPPDHHAAALDGARRTLADCDRRLARYRALLDEGTEPSVIATWLAELQSERLSAERIVAEHAPRRAPTALEIRTMVEELGEMTRVLATADPEDKTRLYAELGLTLTYRPGDETVAVEAKPRVGVWTCRRGDSNPHTLSGTSPSS